jgi:hypothetical protein
MPARNVVGSELNLVEDARTHFVGDLLRVPSHFVDDLFPLAQVFDADIDGMVFRNALRWPSDILPQEFLLTVSMLTAGTTPW